MNKQERFARLEQFREEGRILRKAWTGTDDEGRETACLLAAFAPECGDARDPYACPAGLLPQWLADLTPKVDDTVSTTRWERLALDLWVRLMRKAADWTPEEAARFEIVFRRIAIEEARSHVSAGHAALPSIDAVLALHRRAEAGDTPSDDEWDAARDAARAASRGVGRGVAMDAALAASSYSVRAVASAAAWAAVWATAWDTAGDAAGDAARAAAMDAARAAAWDRMVAKWCETAGVS
jgi:hypothetical protein